MRSSHRLQLAALAAALFVSACSDSPVQPTSDAPASLDAALSEMSLGSMGLVASAQFDTGILSTGSPTSSGCGYSASDQSFVCAPIRTRGLTVNRGFTLFSASGTPQSTYERGTTASVRTTTSVAGTTVFSGDTLTMDYHDTMTLSGLLTGTHTLDGTQSSHLTGRFGGFRMDETSNTTIVGLVLPAQPGQNTYPRAGTITVTNTSAATSDFPSSYTSTFVMQFDGTSKVKITISGFGSTQHCVLDLSGHTAMICS